MPSPALSTVTAASAAYAVTIADTPEQVRAAQQLRHAVFGGEMGARLHSPEPGLDIDPFDAIADHLIVTETGSGEVVGTYRLIPPGRGGALYAESEFDLPALGPIRPQLVEAGRSCVHPEHRGGAVINLLWSALARYVLLSGHTYLAGCASVPLDDGGRAATSAWLLGNAKHTAPDGLRVHPHRPWQPAGPLATAPSYADLPPLLRGYLRLGAWVCGAPAYDAEFNVADFYVLLPMANVPERYRRYFLGEDR